MKISTNQNELIELDACEDGLATFVEAHGYKEVLLSDALDSNGWNDFWWFVSESYDSFSNSQKKDLRLLGCYWAESVLHIFEKEYPNDDRPRKSIQASRGYAEGKIDDAAGDAARDAAWAAARDAARDAAGDAAGAAAGAARDAAGDAAGAAAWAARDAAGAAAWDAAGAAARAAARDAAGDAARDAAWAAARDARDAAGDAVRKEQINDLKTVLKKWESQCNEK